MERGKGHGGLRSPAGRTAPPPPVAPQGALGKVLSRQHGPSTYCAPRCWRQVSKACRLPGVALRMGRLRTQAYECGLSVRGAHAFTCIHMHDTRMVFGIRSRIESAVNVRVAFLSLRIFTRSAKPAPRCPPPRRSPRGATTPEESPRDPTRALRVIPDTGVPPRPHFDH